MSLKDHYKESKSYFAEPCDTCKYRFKTCQEYPCSECVHNSTAAIEGE